MQQKKDHAHLAAKHTVLANGAIKRVSGNRENIERWKAMTKERNREVVITHLSEKNEWST